ncbi:hypothetical protein OIU34_21555 [Pararhizobium sp. BT-229]|uniref:hypothetical protein n=1 Tax=Pararhizobium sp. BT-229 TaxID=2986923 RepID=UPI0021F7981B|nr:hypothetical protein [Pararhizobium sp. BT-229]MCV9964480.1 hypothetical protein [Pararhizobium sp. BT-229]
MPLRRETPFAFNSEQKAYLENVLKTPSDHARRTRQKGPERASLTAAQRDDFVANAFDQLTWLTTKEGKEHLDSMGEDTISVSASIITNLMHFVAEAGHSPLQVLQTAVLGFSTQSGDDDEFRIVYEFLEEMQDVTDEVIGVAHQA